MATSAREFRVALYGEHLEEASFLYEQRRALQSDPELPWLMLSDIEERIEAHIDALVVGDELALDVCEARARDGDPGELFAAANVFCRRRDAKAIARIWSSLDFADGTSTRALADALKLELPDEWRPACEQALAVGDRRLMPILAASCAHRRVPVGEHIAQRLLSDPERADPETMQALSRFPSSAATKRVLLDGCRHENSQVKSAALASLVVTDSSALPSSYLIAQSEDWPHTAMGLAGDRVAARILRERVDAGRATRDTIIALGLLGDVSCVRSLSSMLSSDDLGAWAAHALRLITGATLVGTTFVPEPVNESELFDHEVAAWRDRGDVPKRADGQPYGERVQQLSRDLSVWNQWLAENAKKFDPSLRYRRGQPYRLRAVFEGLLDPATPAKLRQLTYEELTVRFGCRISFEADARVGDQLGALHEMALWVNANEARFEQSAGRFVLGAA